MLPELSNPIHPSTVNYAISRNSWENNQSLYNANRRQAVDVNCLCLTLRNQGHHLPRELLHRLSLCSNAIGPGKTEDEIVDAQVLVLAYIGGNLLRTAIHHPARRARGPFKSYIGAEAKGYGVLWAARPPGQGAQPGDFAGQFFRLQDGRRAQSNRHPAIPQLRSPADRRASMSSNPDGRMGLLHRLGQEPGPRHIIELAVKPRFLFSPEFFEQPDILVGHCAPLGVGI